MTATIINNIAGSNPLEELKSDEFIKKRTEEKLIEDYKRFVSGRNVLSNEEYKRQFEYFYRNQEILFQLIKLRRDKKV